MTLRPHRFAGFEKSIPAIRIARGPCVRSTLFISFIPPARRANPRERSYTHAALVNRLCWMQSEYQLEARDRVLQKTPFGFDVSVWEFFWPLLYGASLVVAAPGGHQIRVISPISFGTKGSRRSTSFPLCWPPSCRSLAPPLWRAAPCDLQRRSAALWNCELGSTRFSPTCHCTTSMAPRKRRSMSATGIV